MKYYRNCLIISIICFALALFTLNFISCGGPNNVTKNHMFLQKAYTVKIPNLLIIFLGENDKFMGGNTRNGRPVLGQAWKGKNAGIIFMPGTLDKNGKITYDNRVLGEELGHILNGVDKQVVDPHEK